MIYSINAAEFRTPKMGMTQKAATKKMEQSPARNYEGFSTAASNALKAQVAFKGNEAPKGITLGSVEGKPSISATLNGANRIADDLVFSNGEFLIVSKKSGNKREVEMKVEMKVKMKREWRKIMKKCFWKKTVALVLAAAMIAPSIPAAAVQGRHCR